MRKPKEITREEANQIIREGLTGPRKPAAICYAGRWYDIRGLEHDEIEAFIAKLLGRVVPPAERADIKINL